MAASIEDVLFGRTTRSFIVASTRSGKSTLAAALLDCYHRLYPADRIYLVDPKGRYYPLHEPKKYVLFPYGYRSEVYGRRKGVVVNGVLATRESEFLRKDASLYVIQHDDVVVQLLKWIFQTADYSYPTVLFADESFDINDDHIASTYYRRLIQQGGDMGVATLTINQRPRNIDPVMLSESEQVYVGHLRKYEDRDYLRNELDIPEDDRHELWKVPLPQYTWWFVDQIRPERSRKFRLGEGYE